MGVLCYTSTTSACFRENVAWLPSRNFIISERLDPDEALVFVCEYDINAIRVKPFVSSPIKESKTIRTWRRILGVAKYVNKPLF